MITTARRLALGAALALVVSGCAGASTGGPDDSSPGSTASIPSPSTGSVWVTDEGGDSLTVLDGGHWQRAGHLDRDHRAAQRPGGR